MNNHDVIHNNQHVNHTSTPKPTLLIVEDDKNLCNLYSTVAMESGFDVTAAIKGEEAISLLKTRYFNLVLLDLMLPDIDGVSIIKDTKNDPHTARTKFVVITDLTDSNTKTDTLKAGAIAFLAKDAYTPTQVIKFLKENL